MKVSLPRTCPAAPTKAWRTSYLCSVPFIHTGNRCKLLSLGEIFAFAKGTSPGLRSILELSEGPGRAPRKAGQGCGATHTHFSSIICFWYSSYSSRVIPCAAAGSVVPPSSFFSSDPPPNPRFFTWLLIILFTKKAIVSGPENNKPKLRKREKTQPTNPTQCKPSKNYQRLQHICEHRILPCLISSRA